MTRSKSKIYNWSTDEEAFRKADPKGYEIWHLQQMINYGKEGIKISESAVRKNWEKIRDGIDPSYRAYINFLLWPHQRVS